MEKEIQILFQDAPMYKYLSETYLFEKEDIEKMIPWIDHVAYHNKIEPEQAADALVSAYHSKGMTAIPELVYSNQIKPKDKGKGSVRFQSKKKSKNKFPSNRLPAKKKRK